MKHAVTGAFGYSGSVIARRLLAAGESVVTLTNSPRLPDSPDIPAYPLKFDDGLVEALAGVDVLYNTYWVRFNHANFSHQQAVINSRCLFDAARRAGVQRIVHVSITNPSAESHLDYFSGKAQVEQALIDTGVSHAILRPAVLFGGSDILINNIAWLLRTLPVFGVFGDGSYRLQPIHVDDLAALAVDQGRRHENTLINAIGPETFTYRELGDDSGADYWRRAPDHRRAAVGWLRRRLAARSFARRRDHHSRRDRRLDGGFALRRCAARRIDPPHRLGAPARRHARQALRQRTRAALSHIRRCRGDKPLTPDALRPAPLPHKRGEGRCFPFFSLVRLPLILIP